LLASENWQFSNNVDWSFRNLLKSYVTVFKLGQITQMRYFWQKV